MPNFGLATKAAGEVVSSGAGSRLLKDVSHVTRSVDAIAPGVGRVFENSSAPLQHSKFITLIKSSPAKAMASIATAVTGGVIGYHAIEELLNDPDENVRAFAEKALREFALLLDNAGITDPTPEEDGKIAGKSADEMRMNVAIVDAAQTVFDSACAAVGGFSRLMAIQQWLAVDDDLQQIIIDRYKS